jgi:cation transport ATPase
MFTGDGQAAAQAAAAAVGIAEDSTHWSLLPEDKLALVSPAAVWLG